MPTKRRATHQSPAASANDTAPLSTAPTTASAPDDVTRVEMTRQPVADVSYEGLPDKTIREMMAGRAQVMKHSDHVERINTLMTETAQEMFSKQAMTRLTDKRVELQKGTTWQAFANLDVAKHEWIVTIRVNTPGAPPAELSEPFPQFPSDEMIAWLIMVG